MASKGTLYIEKNSPIHRLDGSIKLLLMLIWTGVVFMFNDARVFLGMIILGSCVVSFSKIKFREVRGLIFFLLAFTLFNSLFLILITPSYGSSLTGHSTIAFSFHGYKLTYETLWFALTLSLKYLAILPMTIIFVFTTHPSKFASSLNRIGVSYKIAYAVNIALRYIPDVQDEFINIMHAQEARGVAFKKGDASFFTRFKNYNTILIPLVLSSLNRIEVVSNAMSLRGFGIKKKRTWYNREKLEKFDLLIFFLIIIGFILGLLISSFCLKGFWYPFK